MSHLYQRPDSAPDSYEVGKAIPHESAALHVTGLALYTDDLVGLFQKSTAADAKVRAAPIIRVRIVSLLLWSCWRQERKRRRYVPQMAFRRSRPDGGAAA